MSKNYSCLVLLIIIFFPSCGVEEKSFSFKNWSDFQKSESAKRWADDVVPNGAKDINIWYSIDTNLIRISYVFAGERPIKIDGMMPLNNVLKNMALAELPRISKNERIKDVNFRCRKSAIKPDPNKSEILEYFNVDFLGDTGDVVYYWNTNVQAVYKNMCPQ